LLKLLGIRQVTVVINKMDLVDYSRDVFEQVRSAYSEFLSRSRLDVMPTYFIPVSAREGVNVAACNRSTSWYDGPTVLESLDMFEATRPKQDKPLRMPVQDVYKFDKRRIIAGRVESGILRVGDRVLFSPSRHEGVVKSIERWNSPVHDFALPGESIGLTLTEQLFIERGGVVSHTDNPPNVGATIAANVFWLGNKHLRPGGKYVLKLATQEVECRVAAITDVVDTATLNAVGSGAVEVAKNEIASVVFDLAKPIAFDRFTDIAEMGRFVIVDEYELSGGGTILWSDVASNYVI
jgi:bifunctional enzyme CysN/CysC